MVNNLKIKNMQNSIIKFSLKKNIGYFPLHIAILFAIYFSYFIKDFKKFLNNLKINIIQFLNFFDNKVIWSICYLFICKKFFKNQRVYGCC